MPDLLFRRRRFIAGLVALGALGPKALAQQTSQMYCVTELKSENPRIDGAFSRINQYGPYTSARIRPSRLAAKPELGITGVEVSLSLTQSSTGRSITLDISRLEPAGTGYRKGTAIFTFMRADVANEIEAILNDGRISFIQPDAGSRFGAFSGRLLIRVLFPGSSDPLAPDLTFQYQAEDLNEAWKLAEEALRQSQEIKDAGRCLTKPPPLPYCFLTTAAVDTIGLDDDCWELESLREYRDNWLSLQPGGRELIEEYYKHAPGIAQRLIKEPKRLARLYFTCILPSAVFARLGFNRAARALYSRHMRKLMMA